MATKQRQGKNTGKTATRLLTDPRGFAWRVRVLEERTVYGRKEYRVIPVAGRGEHWVYDNNLFDE